MGADGRSKNHKRVQHAGGSEHHEGSSEHEPKDGASAGAENGDDDAGEVEMLHNGHDSAVEHEEENVSQHHEDVAAAAAASKTKLGFDVSDPHDDDSNAVIYRYKLVSASEGEPAAPVPREDVLDFFYPRSLVAGGAKRSQEELERLNMRRDLFLLAFQAVQQLPSSDRWSYYQIAGIHGLPHQPYDGVDTGVWNQDSTWWGGYCMHGSPLFPTWHRPYMMLLEQSIIRQAMLIAEKLNNEEEKAMAAKIAPQLRLSYWDWANYTTRTLGIPDVFTSTEISLAYTWKSFSRKKIPNPLKSFVLPEDLSSPVASSDVFNPPAKPNYVVPAEGTPYTPKGYPTVRHVNSSYVSQADQLNLALVRDANTTLVEGVYSVFFQRDWLTFSNHSWSEESKGDGTTFGHYASLEVVHDFVHGAVGAPGGHMTYPELAAFDPIFFFHHTNVDRLIALWQYCRPDAWVTKKTVQKLHEGTFTSKPNGEANSSTGLTPFRFSHTMANKFITSEDVRLVDVDCGYTYPEIVSAKAQGWKPCQMLAYVLKEYKPPQYFSNRWVLVVERIMKRAFDGPYYIRIFVDKPDANAKTPLTSPHYAGAITVFARSNATRCANCELRKFMRASVDITRTMVRLGIATAVDLDGEQQVPGVNPLSEAGSVKAVLVDLKGKELDPSSISEWAQGGPKLSLYFQADLRDDEINESLVRGVELDTSQKPSQKFDVTE